MTLPDGGTCFRDRFVVVVKPGIPKLSLDSFENEIALTGIADLDEICRANNISKIEKWYPDEVIHEETRLLVDRMYIFFTAEGIDVVAAAGNFSKSPYIEISEPYRIPKAGRIPNDPYRGSQWFLTKIDAYQAWDIIWGTDTESALIGIVDTGVYWTHPDINPNMWEDIGEDMSNYDGNPTEPSPIHGTHVAGCASEATNNGIGGAGIGWSAHIMAVKGADDYGNLSYVWQGVTWAADHGAKIINCSWGGVGYSSYEQSIINHVYSTHDVLVVAAAGNDDYWTPPYYNYPSAYSHVLAVAATNSSDHKPSWSNYGIWVDICAPGEDIYSTWGSNSYTYLSGTSMSSPIVAGVAALVRAGDPTLSAAETESLVVQGAEPINDSYYNQGFMGSGRVNAYNAVSSFQGLDPPIPAAPANSSFINNHYPSFAWSEIDGATVYHLQVAANSNFNSPSINNSNIPDTSYTSTIYLADGIWYWHVRAGDGTTWSDWSTTWSFGIDTEPPGSPIGFTISPPGWSGNAEFTLNWTDPSDLSGIGLRFYKIDSPPENDFDYDGTLPEPPAIYIASAGGSHIIYLWCMDNMGNVDYQTNVSATYYYDNTPPEGCVALSPPYTSSESFQVSWTTGSDDQSGLSGMYDVRSKEDDGPWTDWLTGTFDMAATFTGLMDHTYYFEARTSDLAGNYEPFTGIAEATTLISSSGSPCGYYVIGDYNGSLSFNVSDIIDAFSRLNTGEPQPALSCECPPGSGNTWAVAMDVNNSCEFNVSDIIAGFSRLMTGEPDFVPCEICPPEPPPIPLGDDKPLGDNKLGKTGEIR